MKPQITKQMSALKGRLRTQLTGYLILSSIFFIANTSWASNSKSSLFGVRIKGEAAADQLMDCPGPVIIQQPADTNKFEGEQVTFSVSVSATGTISYQWQKGNIAIDGATNSNYTISNITSGDAALYNVVITNTDTNCVPVLIISDNATLIVNTVPSITSNPTSALKCVGEGLTFSVTINGTALSYQWRKNGNDLVGATASLYLIDSLTLSDAGSYEVVINGTSSYPITSTAAILIVNEPPVISCPGNIFKNNDSGDCGAKVSFTASSVGGFGTTISYSQNPGTHFPIGITYVNAKAMNSCGSSSCPFSVTIKDNEYPVISKMPSNISQYNDYGKCSALISWKLPKATDNCPGVFIRGNHNPGEAFQKGKTTVTYTATDIYGHSKSKSFTITINDNEEPGITQMPLDIIQNNDPGSCGAIVKWQSAVATDNCPGVKISSDRHSGDVFPEGLTTVTYTATDASKNTFSNTFSIIVLDNENPIISGMPADIIRKNDSSLCGAMVSWIPPVATDNCSGLSLSANHIPGEMFPGGITKVTYTAFDAFGQSSIASFNIMVNDSEKPVFINVPQDIIQSNDLHSCGAIVNWKLPTVKDNCSGVQFKSNHNPGESFPAAGKTLVTYTVTDMNGNNAMTNFYITVKDTEPPVVLCKNIALNLDSSGIASIGVEDVNFGFNDNCSITSKSISKSSFDYTNLGENTVIFTVTDVNNSSSCKAVVTIGSPAGILKDTVESKQEKNLKIYPGTSPGEIVVEINANKSANMLLKIVNIKGQIIYQQQLGHINGIYRNSINLQNISNGIYFLQIDNHEEVINKKFILQK